MSLSPEGHAAIHRRPALPAVGATLALGLVLMSTGCGGSGQAGNSQAGVLNGSQVEFSLSSLGDSPRFFTYETGAGKVGLLAVKDASGDVRVALDTCQVCNGSPKAYFLEKGGMLQCQNCGNTFSYSIVGDAQLGCEPTPLAGGSWSVSGETLSVDEQALENVAPLFTTWTKQ